MYGIFRVTHDRTVIIDKEAALLIPEIMKLTQDELKYVILVYDWFDSPFRKKPKVLRVQQAIRILWRGKKVDPEKKVVVKEAIKAYSTIIYDHTKATADAIRTKIYQLNKKLVDERPDKELTLNESKAIVDQLSFFSDRLDKMEMNIKADDLNFNEIKGKLKLSFVEIWQRRMQEHRKANEVNLD